MPERVKSLDQQLRELEGAKSTKPFSLTFTAVGIPYPVLSSHPLEPMSDSLRYLGEAGAHGVPVYKVNLSPNRYEFPVGYRREPVENDSRFRHHDSYRIGAIPEKQLEYLIELGQNGHNLIDLQVNRKGNQRLIACSYPVNYSVDGVDTTGIISRTIPLTDHEGWSYYLTDLEQEYLCGQEITEAYLKLFIRTWHSNRYRINDNADLLQGILNDKFSHFMTSPELDFAQEVVYVCLRKRDNMGLLLNEIMLGNDFITSKLKILGRGLPTEFSKNDLMDLTLQTRDALDYGDEDFLERVLIPVGRIPGW